jgi:DNA recombination protein RmuC
MLFIVLFCLAVVLGAILWFREHTLRKELSFRLAVADEKNAHIPSLEEALKEKEVENTALKIKQSAADEKLQLIEHSQEKFTEVFKLLSQDALEKNNRSFLDLANIKFLPMNEKLSKLDVGLQQLEKERKGDQEALKQQVHSLIEAERHLKQETANLVRALKAPVSRGRWGEIQLRRVVELAGMINQCDFFEQESHQEMRQRPDLIVRLPGGRQVVIDAKVPLDAYLDAYHTNDETLKELKLKEHASQLRAHIMSLSKKAYWENFQPTPEFVILFLPSEVFFSAALEQDPHLIEFGVEDGVILATPTTLIALLRSIAYGWKQENLSRFAQEVSDLGHELYKRIIDMGSHWGNMGKSLSSAVEHYNKAVGSLETRVLVTARKFKEMGAGSSNLEIKILDAIEKVPRQIEAPDVSP